ncbi:DUF5615 family PIN-like protein [Candidatus Thiothrix sp. Deng01]|uniref:DUF5615 family PIN-like protein n=1 Tax=Candidatus Thiothrix phosphatis TaxID=3112415 RepID=A0ABU6D0S9_9GAMM|nr:DUF5615 family PIN-like protein [Candidatus Thiothrix sp. Deng01]MEB4591979.1 DUF5615 family PIN-like protein [Candidatus Thiothrix sp. Deng01]
MLLLLDQGLPRSAAGLLRQVGIDAIHVGEIGMAAAKDVDILHHASKEGRAVVTLDADFHALLAMSSAVSPSVIRIRIEGLKAVECASLIQTVLSQCQPDIEQGSVVTVQGQRIRIRRLPIG